MKKSFITISLVAALVVSGTAIYSANKTTNKSQISPVNKVISATSTTVKSTQIAKKTNNVNLANITNPVHKKLANTKETTPITQNNLNHTYSASLSPTKKMNESTIKNITKVTSNSITVKKASLHTKEVKKTTTLKITTPKIEKKENIKATKEKQVVITKPKTTNLQLSDSQIYARLKNTVTKTSMKNTAFVTNLNDYKVVNGKKYYNVYEYYVGNKSNNWVFNGNYSNFIGARYLDIDGEGLNTQFIQDFKNISTTQKKSYIKSLATQFASYFPNNSSNISVDMSKNVNFEGYTCYLVHIGDNSFYMTPAGFIYIPKKQSFY